MAEQFPSGSWPSVIVRGRLSGFETRQRISVSYAPETFLAFMIHVDACEYPTLQWNREGSLLKPLFVKTTLARNSPQPMEEDGLAQEVRAAQNKEIDSTARGKPIPECLHTLDSSLLPLSIQDSVEVPM